MARQLELDLSFSEAQNLMFYELPARFPRCVYPKGRRLGFTRGGAQAIIDEMLSSDGLFLWGDTINGNIDRYMERYFMPVLKQLDRQTSRKVWNWDRQRRMLEVGNSCCDFRSADKPENWEGFGYKKIILNEAGIILNNRYLWENAVSPMLMDFQDAICIIGGTPKGKNLYWELSLRASQREYQDRWITKVFSTFDNPFLTKASINQMIADLPPGVVDQEIYGIFLDTTDHQFIDGDIVEEAMNRLLAPHMYHDAVKVMGVDVGRFGDDPLVICKRQGPQVISFQSKSRPTTGEAVSFIGHEINTWNPDAVFVDVGYNPGVYDGLVALGFTEVKAVQFGGASVNKYYKNKRAEMWGEARDFLAAGGAIQRNSNLRTQLTAQTYRFTTNDGSQIVLTEKEEIKAIIGMSTDEADSFCLTFAAPVRRRTLADDIANATGRNVATVRRTVVGGTHGADYDVLDFENSR